MVHMKFNVEEILYVSCLTHLHPLEGSGNQHLDIGISIGTLDRNRKEDNMGGGEELKHV